MASPYTYGTPPELRGTAILSQGLDALIARREMNQATVMAAEQFSALGTPEGAQMASLIAQNPAAAQRMFTMFGGADKLLANMQARAASQRLAEAMASQGNV
jgi:hypothetical protein